VEGGIGNTESIGICHSYTPDGRCVSLLKLLLTNYCIYDCTYCVNRISSNTPRARFTPDEVVSLTIEFYKRNYIEGLFLSSGIIQSPDYTMEQLIRVARTLRQEHLFGGYIHLKAAPGASPDLMLEAGKWADRLSANIEMPLQSDLDKLAPAKTHTEIEHTMADIQNGTLDAKDRGKRNGQTPTFAPAGQSTQMMIGATASADSDILHKSSDLYSRYRLRRVYYSAFSPIPHADSRLPLIKAPLMREHRLYQADWLMRFYGFDVQEITTPQEPNLPLDKDPKLAWALRNRAFFPVDVNAASQEALLRVPGFGVRNVHRMVRIRKYRRLKLPDLACLKVPLSRAKYFIVTADHNPDVFQLDTARLPARLSPPVTQLSLFETATTALTGEL
jgi:putative DNA modification/repair radical SAM protein